MVVNKIRVDYHFHPNFSLLIPFVGEFLSKRIAKKIWEAFKKNNLDVVLVTEHVYKCPKRSFEILEETRPKDAITTIIPGIEVLTKEGTDMIVFSKKKQDVYSQQSLLSPWKLTVKEVVELLKKEKNILGIVAHPFTPGGTSMIRNNGEKATKEAVRELGFIEGHNCTFTHSARIFRKFKLNKIFKKKYQQMEEASHVPEEFLKEARVITTGSDAHHIWEIGDCCEIDAPRKQDLDYLFKIITTINGRVVIKKRAGIICFIKYIFGLGTYAFESTRKIIRLYSIEKPIQKQNWQ